MMYCYYKILINIICFTSTLTLINGQLLEGIYCGKENCYDLLGVTREATKNEIARNYRKLAKKYHPDLQHGEQAKFDAEEQFKIIANAYEILKDDESRSDYDYMLDNPNEYYAHYYRYYRRRVAPKVDVRLVLAVTISVISLVQYYSAWQRYETAIKYFASIPKYRNRALDIAKEENLIPNDKKNRGKNKAKQTKDLEDVIRKVIEEKMDIKGAYAKPSITDILWIQLVMSPYLISKYVYWYVSWIVRHNILRHHYNEEEKLYMIRKFLKMGQHQFNSLEDSKKDDFLHKELWIREKFNAWHADEEERMKKQLAESNKYKQYRRYIKNHGISRMTFDDS